MVLDMFGSSGCVLPLFRHCAGNAPHYLHTRATLVTFGATAWIPTVQALAFFIEIGPLVTGLLVAGRVGSGGIADAAARFAH
jgi:phospholipid/cholesterol/gamma-HCH transport system permease protein